MSESLADAINSAPPEKRKEILSQLKRWTRKEDNTMKEYFDETEEIVGWVLVLLGLVGAFLAALTDVIPKDLAPAAVTVAVAGGALINDKVRKVVQKVGDGVTKSKDDKPDVE